MIKKLFVGTLLMFVLLGINAQTINVATYNLRFDNRNDSLDLWENRFPIIAEMVKFYGFEIFGTQEGLKNQLQDLKSALPQFEYIGVGRTDGKDEGEHSAIFYNTSKFKLMQQGNFWLSEITDKPNIGWDAALPRICSWGKFMEKSSGFSFFMFNVHFDHKGVLARKESAKLILSKCKEIAGVNAVILTGDFNVDETNESYLLLKNSGFFNDAYEMAAIKLAPSGTFNNFDVKGKPVGRIDHIFLTSDFEVKKYGILTNTYNGHFPSDHFPVLVKIKHKK